MKKIITTLAGVLLASNVSATVINFDTDSNGVVIAENTPITNQYQDWGVMFAGFENGIAVDINAAPDPDGVDAPSPRNVLTNCSDASAGCPGNRADLVSIMFDNAVSNISLMLDTLGGDSVTFDLFNSNDDLVESLTITSGGSVFIPVSFTSSGIVRIDAFQPNDDWAWAMDDLSFDAAAIPEPSSFALFAVSLLGFGLARRKTK